MNSAYYARLTCVEIMLWNLDQVWSKDRAKGIAWQEPLDFHSYRRLKLRLMGILP